MSKGIDLKGIDCRGRNGWFKYDNYFIMVADDFKGEEPKQLALVEINSRRAGKSAPITISGDPDKVIQLLECIVDDLKRVKQIRSAQEAWKNLKEAIFENKHQDTRIIRSSKDLIDQALGRAERG